MHATFGNMGTLIRSGWSIIIERGHYKNMLISDLIKANATWFNSNYPMSDVETIAEHGNRVKIRGVWSYRIVYLDKIMKTELVIYVMGGGRKRTAAYCYLSNAVRTFKRSGINEIAPAYLSLAAKNLFPQTRGQKNFNKDLLYIKDERCNSCRRVREQIKTCYSVFK